MASNLCQSSVKITVAQICQSLGWNSIMATPLDLLVDIMERYLTSIGRTTQKYSEQFGRSDASYGDSLLALTDMGVCLPELLDYMKNVDPVEFPKKMPAFPAPKSCKLIYADDTGDGDAPGSGRSPLHSTSAGESLSNSILAVNRRSLTTSSPDQLRPLQELGNSEFRARCRQLLDSDGTDVEERLSKAPDPRPPLQMAQIMRQRRPALSIPPISISGVTTSVLVLNSGGVGGSGAEAARQLSGSDLAESFPVKVKKDRSAQAAPATASKSSSAKRSKAGGSKAAASAATSKASSDPKRREKAAVAKQRKRDQGYNALAEALTAAPLQCSSATSVAAAAQPATDWLSAPAAAAAGAPSRSASRHAALSAAHEPPIAAASAGASSRGSSRSASPANGPSRRPRGVTAGAPSAAATAAATMRHLDDTFDAVIRGGGGASSGDEDAGDRDEEEVDVDVEELNQSHEQLASPPPHLLPLSTASFAPLPPRPPRGRSTIDDVIDSVARGDDIEVECGVDGSEQAAVDDRDSVRKRKRSESGEERPRKRKKKKSKARSKPLPPLPPSLVDTSGDAARGEPAPEEVECHADVDSVAGSPEPPPPAFASSPAATPEPQHELLEVEVVHEPAADEPSINIVDDDIEVVHEVEVEHDVASVGQPPLQAASGVSMAGERRPPSLEDASLASGNEFAAMLPAVSLGDDQLAEASLPGEAVAERKEKHKKEKKEKKKKKNKERHRDRRHAAGDDDATAASPSSSAKLHGHKERSKGEKERRHKHHHHRTDGSGGDSRDSERKREQHSGEHRHKVKDKRAAFAGSDGEQKHEPELAAEVEAAVSTAPVPKLLFKIAGKTISTVSQAESGGSGAAPVASLSADRLAATQSSSVAAAPLPRKKPTEIYTETEFTGTREVVDIVQEADDSKVWICPGCHQLDDGSPMIGCDKCEDWYHWTCVGIVIAPPDDATWYCPRCVTKKPPKKKAKR